MSEKPIEYTGPGGNLVRIMAAYELPTGGYGGSESDERDAAEADLLAAGYVPVSQLAEVTAQLEETKLDFANACDVGRRLESRLNELGSVYGWTDTAPEAAKPAEPYACPGDIDATIPWDEPASPPSPAQAEPWRCPECGSLDRQCDVLGHLEQSHPQPPAAPGAPLTVEAMVEALHYVCENETADDWQTVLYAVIERLERAQKGGGP